MAACEESFNERQENELQVLQSVFMEDLKDLRESDVWKVQRPPEIQLSLTPQQSMGGMNEVYAKVDLCIKCTAHYPEEVPEIRLANAKGLSNHNLSVLSDELGKLSKELKGEVMIFELAQHVQTFLHAHNHPPCKSFYEEMMKNKMKKEEQLAQEHQKKADLLKRKEEKERQQLDEEIFRRQEALREETRRRKEEAKQNADIQPVLTQTATISVVPSTPMTPVARVTPIPMDTEQRQRARTSVSPHTPVSSPRRQFTRQRSDSGGGSYHKDRRRHTSTPRIRQSSSESQDDEGTCMYHTGTSVLAFNTKGERTVHRGKCIGHSPRGSTVYAGMDTSTGELVTVAEWELKWWHTNRKLDADDKDLYANEESKFMKQVLSIESELLSLVRLHHKNLIHYLALDYQKHHGKVMVYVLMEYAGGGSLELHLKNKHPLPVEVLRGHTVELLDALVYLHSKAVVHKDLRASSVFIDDAGKVRLADYSLDKRLSDMYAAADTARPGVHFTTNKPPTLGRGGKKGDIYTLGILLLSLSQGFHITDQLPEVPANLPADFQDFLTKCLIKDERHRWSAFQLLDHDFIKPPLNKGLPTAKEEMKYPGQKEGGQTDQLDEPDSDTELHIIASRDPSGHSRLYNEFEILKWLGKGGFGDVIKVKNKLDGRLYAIKRIPLNPKSKLFTRKITREVKLLSRLNHENVVRYYNSWIETSDEPIPSDSSTSTFSTGTPKTSNSVINANQKQSKDLSQVGYKNSLGILMDVENLAPAEANSSVEWSVSQSASRVEADNESSSSSDEDFDDDVFGASFLPMQSDSDDGIVFEGGMNFDDTSDTEESKDIKSSEENGESKEEPEPKLQFLYIQMEYCEKSTLRNCIDAGLYEDMDRVWRLFREIIEGLVHIHEQGMIHRDLKPVNIFLDSNDHVKIGDFGLATTDILTMQHASLLDATLTSQPVLDVTYSSSRSGSIEGDMTGKVGTALYVSPEMMNAGTKTSYNQKVDIYSLGVILFEMCYKPLPTGMERVKILTCLRQPAVILPDDFDVIEMEKQTFIIKWLLSHEPIKRPTSQELLQSEYLPPPQMEEAELNEVLRSTISNPQSKTYKKMISALFSQPVDLASEYLYDADMQKGFSYASTMTHQHVFEVIEKIFLRHGAVKVNTPMLMPKCKLYEHTDLYMSLMDHSGGVVGLPFDLRIPFARFVARNGVNFMKRYAIDKVFRAKRLYGYHPRELTECAFDIVTGTPGNLVPDAEVIHVVYEIISEFPSLQNRGDHIRISHTSLLKGILLHCGIPEDKHTDVLAILADKVEKQKKLQVQTKLCSLSLTDQTVGSLYKFIEMEGPFNKMASILKSITKTKGPAGHLAKQGLHEIEAIINNLTTLGVKMQVILAPGLLYNVAVSSGAIFQIASNVTKKKRVLVDILAAGGRYDKMISEFRRPGSSNFSHNQAAVGISIAFEKIVAAVPEQEEFTPPSAYDILVCTLGHKPMLKDQLSVARDLWAAGLKTDILYDTMLSLEDIQEYCRQHGITHMVILKDMESGMVKVRSLEDRIVEKKLPSTEICDYLQQKLQAVKSENIEPQQSNVIRAPVQSNQWNESNSNQVMMDITFLPLESSKLASNTKRKYEAQIYSKISPAMQQISSKCRIQVLAVDLTGAVLKTIAAFIETEGSEEDYNASIGAVIKEHPKHRKYFTRVFDSIYAMKFQEKSVVVLYSLKDDNGSFRILL